MDGMLHSIHYMLVDPSYGSSLGGERERERGERGRGEGERGREGGEVRERLGGREGERGVRESKSEGECK
jgi:hypothetical protein